MGSQPVGFLGLALRPARTRGVAIGRVPRAFREALIRANPPRVESAIPGNSVGLVPRGLYKLCGEAVWRDTQRTGWFPRSGDDLRDGFLHLSFGSQLTETLRRHFGRVRPLWLLELAPEALPPGALRLEPSRGGALFPHLYGDLPLGAVARSLPVVLGADGVLRADTVAEEPGKR